ncbi:hypothetical protein PoB_003918200 [Plakobranchus ocellatus]|uniref:Uncharacterized protein n=1 Tax=Plakobranchus ocellatus TaxID=259542 RepID=A0AAV4B0M4_9GAST|nr:hypothetical protein PoB_003918200 [Plakobranchus ocellatus]
MSTTLCSLMMARARGGSVHAPVVVCTGTHDILLSDSLTGTFSPQGGYVGGGRRKQNIPSWSFKCLHIVWSCYLFRGQKSPQARYCAWRVACRVGAVSVNTASSVFTCPSTSDESPECPAAASDQGQILAHAIGFLLLILLLAAAFLRRGRRTQGVSERSQEACGESGPGEEKSLGQEEVEATLGNLSIEGPSLSPSSASSSLISASESSTVSVPPPVPLETEAQRQPSVLLSPPLDTSTPILLQAASEKLFLAPSPSSSPLSTSSASTPSLSPALARKHAWRRDLGAGSWGRTRQNGRPTVTASGPGLSGDVSDAVANESPLRSAETLLCGLELRHQRVGLMEGLKA